MTTRKELQEWLNRFPEDTIIQFGIQEEHPMFESYGSIEFLTPNLEDNDCGDGWEFLDFRNFKFTKPKTELEGKCFLQLGESK